MHGCSTFNRNYTRTDNLKRHQQLHKCGTKDQESAMAKLVSVNEHEGDVESGNETE